MTPHPAATLTIHEPDVVEIASTAERLFTAPKLVVSPPFLHKGQELDEARLPAIWRRESLHRRLLGLFDFAGAAVALTLVLDASTAGHSVATAAFGTLLLAPLAFMSLRKRSLQRGLYSVVSWCFHAAGLVRGLVRGRRGPAEAIASRILREPSEPVAQPPGFADSQPHDCAERHTPPPSAQRF